METLRAVSLATLVIVAALLVAAIAWRRRAGGRASGAVAVVPVLAAFLAIAALVGWTIERTYEDHEQQALVRMQAVSRFQAAQLSDWVRERRADAEFARTSDYLATLWTRWRASGAASAREELASRLSQLSPSAVYADALVVDDTGRVLWSREDSTTGLVHARLQEAARTAARTGTPVMVGPYRDDEGRIWLDFAAPLKPQLPQPVTVVLRTAPETSIYPMLAAWPWAADSGETLLVEYTEDHVVYLNALRRAADAPARLTRPLDDQRLLSVLVRKDEYRAGNGVRGVDYAGVPVLGAGHAVPGTDWRLLAKIDIAEARGDALLEVAPVLVAALLALLAAAESVVLWRQRQALELEQRLREDQQSRLQALQLLEAISANSPDAIYAKDRDGRYVFFNAEAGRLVGRAPREVLGLTDRDLYPADEAAAVEANDRRVLEESRPLTVEETLSTVDGKLVLLAVKGPLRDAEGRPTGTYGISRNVTAARNALLALGDRERKLSAIIDNSPSVLSMKDAQGRYVIANPYLQQLLGRTESEILGRTDAELHTESVARMLMSNDERVLATRASQRVEEVIPTPAGPRTYASYMFPVLDPNGEAEFICRIALDITETLRVSALLEDLAADLSSTLQAIPDLMFEIDEYGQYLSVRTTQSHLLAAPAGTLIGRRVQDVLSPDAAATAMAAVADARRDGTSYGRTIELELPDGPRQFELSVAAKPVVAGAPRRYIVLSRDVTARAATESKLRRRTDELARRNEELERFNRLTVGRELDMIELKKEVNALRRELGREQAYVIPQAAPRGGSAPPT